MKIEKNQWNVVKLYKRDFKFSLLSYPSFDIDSYPPLNNSYTVDLTKLTCRKADYTATDNPPILHRKELFVPEDYPLISEFRDITHEGETIGLYENPRNIGFKKNWHKIIKQKGYILNKDGRLEESTKVEGKQELLDENEQEIKRHLTAIDRSRLSQPVHLLARYDYLSGDYSFLDYGCGKGDDIRELEAHGLNCSGWDPLHHPEGELVSSDIVNLGFVLNVIEDKNERSETLRRAFEYCDKLLIVSVMIANDSHISKFTPYKDGVITSIKTFQKYYAQSEIKYYLESVLNLDAIPVSQGIFIVFKDKLEEQLFLSKRQHIKRDWKYKTQKNIEKISHKIKENIVEKNIDLFTDFWETSLDLGRVPANDEFEYTHEIRKIAGSHARVHNSLLEYFGEDLFNEAAKKRKDDLLVYFTMGLFEKRKSQSKLPLSLQRDIKSFFSNYKSVIEISNELLFSVSNTEIIENACLEAHEKFNCGYLESGHSYTFHKSLLSEAPIVLRVYVGCAIQLHGDLENIQLIKAHFTSGKVSLMGYSDWDTDTPHLIERVKIKMREQDVDYFDYIDTFTPPPLLNKKDFFDKKLFQELGIIF